MVSAQNVGQDPIWQQVADNAVSARGTRRLVPEKYRLFRLNQTELTRVLDTAPLEFSGASRENSIVLTVPKPDGTMMRFRLEESPIMAPPIAAQFPNWKTYQGYGIDEPQVTARFDWTDTGFHGYVFATEGTFSVDPYQTNDRENYMTFYKHEFGTPTRQFHCRLDELLSDEKGLIDSFAKTTNFAEFAHGSQIRTYRLAISATSEYTNFFRQTGDTDAQAQERALNQIVTSVNRIDAVYRKELAISFTLVSGTNLTFVTNPETPSDYANAGSSADLTANQTNVTTVIGSANYDIAHLFETTDSGIASLGVVCNPNSKARGLSGQPNPVGDPFDVDYVAHEMGHQFAANHTFNATSDCNSAPMIARREPGSAVTIMGYAGICGSVSNVQRNSIDTFHVYNLANEIIPFVTTGNGSTCGTTSGTNNPPIVAAPSDYTIPFNTPFSLTAGATDADGDPLTYSWEQNDPGASNSNYPATTDDDDVSLVFRPGFRSYLPTVGATRSFPSLTYILNNSNEAPVTFTGTSAVGAICAAECITGEDLPSAARTMNFRVTVRDGRGGISDAGTVLTVVNTTTPFKVTTQNSSLLQWGIGTTKTVTWNVSGTNAAPISAANVKISLSTDGGQTFPHVLAATTANDGSENITVPNLPTTTARIKIEALGNIFFDINDVNFTITDNPVLPRYMDFDGDDKTDIGVFRPSNGQWWYVRSSDLTSRAAQFSSAIDKPVPGDYTGDGKTDVAHFRTTTGEWFILRSEDNSYFSFPLGLTGDIPAPADYDGDGRTDAAVFRPSTATWYIFHSGGSGYGIVTFGLDGDKPVVADYDGDGKADIAVWRPSNGTWWIVRSSDLQQRGYGFGLGTDKPVPGDYTGDGKADIAVWRDSSREWFFLRSEDGSYYSYPFGLSGDVPVPGDYDGDGRFDAAVFRPSDTNWYVQRSTAGIMIQQFGLAGDTPIPASFVP